MRLIGLVVEGFDDEAALPELVRKCHGSDIRVEVRVCGPKAQLLRKFPGFLEEFRRVKEGTAVDKALVICDADRKDPASLRQQMRNKIASRLYPFPVVFWVIVQELEAWLLPTERAPENLANPKERLRMSLSRQGITYTPAVARRLAAAMQVEGLAARYPAFRGFPEAVQNG